MLGRSSRASIQNIRTGLRDYGIFRIVVTKNPVHLLILKILFGQRAFRLRSTTKSIGTGLRDFRIFRVAVTKNPVHLLILKILFGQRAFRLRSTTTNLINLYRRCTATSPPSHFPLQSLFAETLQCNVCTAKKSTFVERSRNE